MSIIRKSLLLAISGAILASVPLATAKWHSPIHPGDHVFDAKRFTDSVKETAEMVKMCGTATRSCVMPVSII